MGTFGQPQGLKGEIKINIFTSSFDSFKKLKKFFIKNDKSILKFKSFRQVGKKIIASIEECKDRNSAFLFNGIHILALREDFPKTNNDEYYIFDLLGCTVIDIKKNTLGIVEDIKNFGAGDLIEINHPDKKNFYIPMNEDNLIKININEKNIIVDPILGLLD